MSNRLGSKGSIGYKKQADFDTKITVDQLVQGIESENFDAKPTIYKDNSLIGQDVQTDDFFTGYEAVSSTLGIKAFHPINDNLLSMLFGDEAAVSDPVKSFIVITAKSNANNYIRLSLVGTDLIAEKSTNGSAWSADTAFCTTGTMSLVAAAYDTVAEVVTAINGYTGYAAVLIGGNGSEASTNIPAFAVTTLKSLTSYIPLFLKSAITASTTAKAHNMQLPVTGVNSCYSFLVNRNLGTNQSINFTGCKANQLTIKAEAGNPIAIDIALVGKKQETAQTDVAITRTVQIPYTAAYAKIVLIDYETGTIITGTEVKSLNLTAGINLDDGKYIGDQYIYEPKPQNKTVTLDFSIGNNSNNYGLKAIFDAVTSLQAYIYIGHGSYCDSSNAIPYSICCKMSNIKLTESSSVISTRDKLIMTAKAELLAPKNSENKLDFIVVDTTTATY